MQFLAVGRLLVFASAALPAQGFQHAVAQAELLGARTGLAVIDNDGPVQKLSRADEPFAPASNMKLCTAAAVLSGLGGGFEFKTRFELVAGRLLVHAGGDPNWIMGTPYASEVAFAAVVSALQRLGIAEIRGVALMAGAFTGPTRPSTWPADQLGTYYCAPTGPFVLEQGTFLLRVNPAQGSAEVAILAPVTRTQIEGHILPVEAKKGAVYGAIDTDVAVRVSGKVWQKASPAQIRVAVHDPAAWFLRAFELALHQGGIKVTSEAPESAAMVLEYSTPLQVALRRMLLDSSNFDAEQCLRVLGAESIKDGSLHGGIEAGTAQIARLLRKVPAQFVMADGSGLSRENRVTPTMMVQLVALMVHGANKDSFLAALPIASESGTLESRFEGSKVAGRVRAKTGWIRGVSALSGVLQRADGSSCVFSILMNYDATKGGLNPQLKQLQEQIVEALDRPAMGSR
ncbi:peptidase S13 [Planctomycetota bacterium]|nr:peptidase S13 [Planctomycetota bacterium]